MTTHKLNPEPESEIHMMNTEIRYLVKNETSGMVFEVMGTAVRYAGTVVAHTIVFLQSVTDRDAKPLQIPASEAPNYFVAMPLDQVSQDRMDARDIEVAHAYARPEFAAGDLLRNPASGYLFRVVEWSHAVILRNVVTGVRSAIPADMARELDRIDPDAAHRHEVAEHCGIADSELPATLPVSADRLLGRALYFVRELLDPTGEDLSVTARSRKVLADLDAS